MNAIDKKYGPFTADGTNYYTGNLVIVSADYRCQVLSQPYLGGKMTHLVDPLTDLIELNGAKDIAAFKSMGTVRFTMMARGVIVVPVSYSKNSATGLEIYVWVPVVSSTGAISYPAALGSSSVVSNRIVSVATKGTTCKFHLYAAFLCICIPMFACVCVCVCVSASIVCALISVHVYVFMLIFMFVHVIACL